MISTRSSAFSSLISSVLNMVCVDCPIFAAAIACLPYVLMDIRIGGLLVALECTLRTFEGLVQYHY